jgi:hypothetical protein
MITRSASPAIDAIAPDGQRSIHKRRQVARADINDLPVIVALALQYKYPHSVLGTPGAEEYVLQLAQSNISDPNAGWYITKRGLEVRAAAHLSIYGRGDGQGHTLWKVRHPLAVSSHSRDLTFLLKELAGAVVQMRRGTGKVVLFLGEHEAKAAKAAQEAGYLCEGSFSDYYRLGECCFVYARTVRCSAADL